MSDRPPVLFATAPIPTGQTIAIDESRDTTPAVAGRTRELAAALASEQVIVVSGLAKGVDAAAHWGALDAAGKTIAVMGTGITRIYPEENTELAAQSNTWRSHLAESSPNPPCTKTTFLRRNHVIAGLSDVSLVMDGQARSGSRHRTRTSHQLRPPSLDVG